MGWKDQSVNTGFEDHSMQSHGGGRGHEHMLSSIWTLLGG